MAHGSSCRAGVDEARALGAEAAKQLPDLAVELGFLELADPPASAVLDRFVRPRLHEDHRATAHAPRRRPRQERRARHRPRRPRPASGRWTSALAHRSASSPSSSPIAQRQHGGRHGAAGLPLLVVARGTSDPDANAEACRAARLLAEWSGASAVDMGFTGVTWPSVPDALDQVARLGHERIGVFFWFLATGKLIERARDQMADFRAANRDRGRRRRLLRPRRRDLVPVIDQRCREALDGVPRTNCDTCSYRAAVARPRGPRRPTARRRPVPPRRLSIATGICTPTLH